MSATKSKFEVWQDPGNHKWFITRDGLMDVEAGYFDTEQKARWAMDNLRVGEKAIEMPDDLVPNLDDYSVSPDDMFKLQEEFKAIAKTFNALASYSEAKGHAMQMRLKGKIAGAKQFEDCLDSVYAQLPEWSKW